MKRIFSVMVLIFLKTVSFSQSVEQGEKFYYYERWQSAEQVFHEEIKKNPENTEAWCWLVRTLIEQGKTEIARDTLAKSPASISEEPYMLAAKGAVLLNTNQSAASTQVFQQAVEKTKSKDAGLLSAIAAILIDADQGNWNYALELLGLAAKRNKKDASIPFLVGKAQRRLHNGTAAYQAFNEAIEKDKQLAAAYYELGRIFVTQKNTEMYKSYFNQAIAADQSYSPALYALYTYTLYQDPVKANEYFQAYMKNADKSVQQDYDLADLQYLNKQHDAAISLANRLITTEGDKVQPRLYKLIAYAYMDKKDSSVALQYMNQYLAKSPDSNFIAKDFETTALLNARETGKEDTVIYYLEKAIALNGEPSAEANIQYYRQLAAYAAKTDRQESVARWLSMVYKYDPKANNVTLFNWGLAAFKAADFNQADSAFEIYTTRYPEQGFGYYWRARSNAAIDTSLTLGLAIPHYQKLVAQINKDSASAAEKKWMKEAFGYLASYEANTEKDYPEAIGYFEQLLEIDPANEVARKNIEILEKNLEIKNKQNTEGVD